MKYLNSWTIYVCRYFLNITKHSSHGPYDQVLQVVFRDWTQSRHQPFLEENSSSIAQQQKNGQWELGKSPLNR